MTAGGGTETAGGGTETTTGVGFGGGVTVFGGGGGAEEATVDFWGAVGDTDADDVAGAGGGAGDSVRTTGTDGDTVVTVDSFFVGGSEVARVAGTEGSFFVEVSAVARVVGTEGAFVVGIEGTVFGFRGTRTRAVPGGNSCLRIQLVPLLQYPVMYQITQYSLRALNGV